MAPLISVGKHFKHGNAGFWHGFFFFLFVAASVWRSGYNGSPISFFGVVSTFCCFNELNTVTEQPSEGSEGSFWCEKR